MPLNYDPNASYPPLNEDQEKAVAAAAKIVTVLEDPRTEQAATRLGVGGAFFAKGTAGYSTADFTKTVAITVSTTLPRLLASGGTDAIAWAQLGVGLYKAFTSAGKALSKLVKDDVVFENLYNDYKFLTYTCSNNRLDFQNLIVNCSDARQKASNYLEFIKNDELFLAKVYTFLYLKFGVRQQYLNSFDFYIPDTANGKVKKVTNFFMTFDQKSQDIAGFLNAQGFYNSNAFNLPFYIEKNTCSGDQIIQAVREFTYYYENNMLDADFNYCVVMFNNAGFPNPGTLKDETRANNYFFESFRTAARNAEELKKKKQEQTTIFYYIVAIILILILFYYFYYSKK